MTEAGGIWLALEKFLGLKLEYQLSTGGKLFLRQKLHHCNRAEACDLVCTHTARGKEHEEAG